MTNFNKPPGLEIMGFGTLEPGKYMNSPIRKSENKECPFKSGKQYHKCTQEQCAIWNETENRCGMKH